MVAVTPELIQRAITKEPHAVKQLYSVVLPVARMRITRVLLCRGASRYRDLGQEVLDLTQDVFLSLLERDGHRLRSWDPVRGLSFENYVGVIAAQCAAATFRKQGDGLWRDVLTAPQDMEGDEDDERTPERIVGSRQALETILTALRAQLQDRGMLLFHLLFVEERSVEEICTIMDMSESAVYAWRSRLGRRAAQIARDLFGDEPGSEPGTVPEGAT